MDDILELIFDVIGDILENFISSKVHKKEKVTYSQDFLDEFYSNFKD